MSPLSPEIAITDLDPAGAAEVRSVPWREGVDLRPRALWEVLTDEPADEPQLDTDGGTSDLGYAEGIRRARSTVDTIVERYHNAIAELEFLRDRIVIESEEDLVELSLQIAREVLEADVSARRDFTVRMVAFALKSLRGSDAITLRIGPTDLKALREKRPELISDQAVVHIVEDGSLTLGGVVAECEVGRIDATLEGRLREAGRQLRTHASSDGEGA